MTSELKRFVEEKRDEMMELLERLVQIDSFTSCTEGVDAAGDILAEAYRGLGFTIAFDRRFLAEAENWALRFFLPGHPTLTFGRNVIARKAGTGGPRILCLCHIDTAFPSGTLTRFPFRREGDLAFGPGVADMKAGVVQILYATRALEAVGFRGYGSLTVFHVADEEAGSIASRPLIEAEARQADWVFVTEPAMADGRLKIRRKGIGIAELEVRGRPAHIGTGFEEGASAVEAMAHKILEIQRLTDLQAGIVVNAGEVHGGTRRNVVPAQAIARIDARVNTEAEWARVRDALEAIARRNHVTGTMGTVLATLSRPPMVPSERTERLVATMQALARELGFGLEAGATGAASDGSFAAAVGTPTVDGLGPIGRRLMTDEEHIVVPTLYERTALLAATLTAVGDLPAP